MAEIPYNKITNGSYIILDSEPYEVLDSHIFRKQQRKAVNKTKLRNLISGKVTERSFHQSEKVEEAEVDKKDAVYIYFRNGHYWLHAAADKSDRFSVPQELVGEPGRFLVNGTEVTALMFNNEVIGLELPIKMELSVTQAPPGDKGNTAQGGTKQVTLESGAVVTTPLFVKEGDRIRINTRTGEYTERATS